MQTGFLTVALIGTLAAAPVVCWGQTNQTEPSSKVMPSDIEQDTSGHGAVLCIWEIYISVRAGLDICTPGEHKDLRDDLSDGITAMNRFIVANNIPPVSSAQVNAAVAARDKRYHDEAAKLAPDKIHEQCTSDETTRLIGAFEQESRDQRRRRIADLLSVPRQPLMNPCL